METEGRGVPAHALTIERVLAAPAGNVWRCWTEPELFERWFCPKPWHVSDVTMDVRPGGEVSMTMNGPEGERFESTGVFLAVEPMHRLVTTDAFRPGWIPSERAFMVAETLLADAGGGRTDYVARALHWDEASRKEHEAMGFHEGWGKAVDQLEELAGSL